MLPALRDVSKKKLLWETAKVDEVLRNLKHTALQTNKLFHVGAVVVTNKLGVKVNKAAERKESM